jgi:hypothetical protein
MSGQLDGYLSIPQKLGKAHTGPTSKMSTRLEARLESFGSSARTLQSCIQSDVFVCSSLLKLVCSY